MSILTKSQHSFPLLFHYKNTSPIEIHIFPDSGASIFLAGPTLVQKLNVKHIDLIPCYKKIKIVGGSTLTCHGTLPEKFGIGSNNTIHNVYIYILFLIKTSYK